MLRSDVTVDVNTAPWPSLDARDVGISGKHLDEVVGLLDEVRLAFGSFVPPPPNQVSNCAAARTALDGAWQHVFGAIASPAHGNPSGPGLPRNLALLQQIKQADQNLLIEMLRYRDSAFERVRDALGLVRDVESTEALLKPAAAAICALGFDRAILSRIEDSTWVPERVHVERDEQWALEILEAGGSTPQVLDYSLVETEMIRRKVGILIRDVQDRPGVHRPIASASKSRSYVAAPLIAGGDVVGFLHADLYYQRRDPHDFDRRMLTMFAEGLSQVLARTAMTDRLVSLSAGLGQLAEAAATAPTPIIRMSPAGSANPHPSELVRETVTGAHNGDRVIKGTHGAVLTRREVEVLRLLANGSTNGRIARQLVVSEGTVKSHVKNILRKLGVENRVKAAARWHEIENRGGSASRLPH